MESVNGSLPAPTSVAGVAIARAAAAVASFRSAADAAAVAASALSSAETDLKIAELQLVRQEIKGLHFELVLWLRENQRPEVNES
jgi:hypothetical protein